MKKEEIIKILQANDSSLLSFPDRGPWGDKKYRGNCSGFIQAFLMWKYHTQKFAELFAGSGTGYDVAQDMGVNYIGADLNPFPVRPGILSVDAFADDVPEEFYDADMCFMHRLTEPKSKFRMPARCIPTRQENFLRRILVRCRGKSS